MEKRLSKKDLLDWENSLKGRCSVKRLINQSVTEWIAVKDWYTFFKSSELSSVSVFPRGGFL